MDISTPSEAELNQLLENTSTSNVRKGHINVKNFVLPERYLSLKKTIKEFEVYDTDVWICGFPKTGTTWLAEITWLITNNLDYERAKIPDYLRTRMLELSMLFDPDEELIFGGAEFEIDSFSFTKNQTHPRNIKSHLPFPLLPDKISSEMVHPKIIYTARNPMDTCISYYHQCKNYEGYKGTMEEFYKLFVFDKVSYGPYAAHVLSFWEKRHNPNFLFLTYEEMKKDLSGVIKKIATLLGKTISPEDTKKLQEYASFDSMKTNPAINKEQIIKDLEKSKGLKITPFIREGKVGGYRNVMSPEIIAQFEYRMNKRFEGSGLNLLDIEDRFTGKLS